MSDTTGLIGQARTWGEHEDWVGLAEKLADALEAAEAEEKDWREMADRLTVLSVALDAAEAELRDCRSAKNDSQMSVVALNDENRRLREALEEVVKQFNLWSEDANDGTYALYKNDGLMVACVNARAALAGSGE